MYEIRGTNFWDTLYKLEQYHPTEAQRRIYWNKRHRLSQKKGAFETKELSTLPLSKRRGPASGPGLILLI